MCRLIGIIVDKGVDINSYFNLPFKDFSKIDPDEW